MKRSLDIEKLLHWAYRDELSKRQSSSAEGIWDRLNESGQLGGIGDDGRRGDRGAQRYDFGLPHPDAEEIERAVGGLERLTIDWEASRETITHGIDGLLTRDVLMIGTIRPHVLVTSHAIRETRPEWYDEPFAPHRTPAEKGPGVKIVGECRGKNLYASGSHCPLTWKPSPYSVLLARADYAAWHVALSQLAASLVLVDHIALPPAAPEAPWIVRPQPAAPPVIVRSTVTMRPIPLRPQRDRAGPPPRRPQHGPVRSLAAS